MMAVLVPPLFRNPNFLSEYCTVANSLLATTPL